MTKSITINGAEVNIVGVTLIVNYRYTPAIPATHWQPADPAEVEILRVEIKDQSGGDAESLLEAIKINIHPYGHGYTTGFALLHEKLLEEHKNEI